MAQLSASDTKLIQYLNEAYGLEKRLETALEGHIAMATHAAYKKRLRQHLTETKRHGRDVQKRIRQLGGEAMTIDAPGPTPLGEAARAVLSGAQKAAALTQGPLHALRGTGEEERQLKNAKTEYTSESEEIATYSAIATLAAALGDKDTQSLARAIGREEERMRAYLAKEIERMVKAVVKAEIPPAQRKAAPRARKPAARAASGTGGAARTKPADRTKPATRRKPAARRKPATGARAA